MIDLSIVVPCYNEEAVLSETTDRLCQLLSRLRDAKKVSLNSKIYFVDDGSTDTTWQLISSLTTKHSNIHGIKLSRNCGHQSALLAGLLTANGEALVSIDADLQDDVAVIEEMVDRYQHGIDIVYGVRKRRDSDSFFKRQSAQLYYKMLKWFGADIVYNHADFRLMSRRSIEAMRDFPESNLFLRAIVRLLGLPSAVVFYTRSERFAGESKYPLRRMLSFALDGVTSFSATPLRFIAVLGIVVFILSITMTLWVLWIRIATNDVVPGWASSVIPIYFLGGIQLLSIGVVGEYVAKIYLETKRRPRYFIEEEL